MSFVQCKFQTHPSIIYTKVFVILVDKQNCTCYSAEMGTSNPGIVGQESQVLSSISSILASSFDIKDTLSRTFDILDKYMGLVRGTLTLKDPNNNEAYIELAHGLSEVEVQRGLYKIGEGITGKVIASGEAAIIPNIADDPAFLNKTRSRPRLKNTAFICVPLKLGDEVIGTLSVDREASTEVNLAEDIKLLSFVAIMIAQEINLKKISEQEKEALKTENLRLRDELREKYNIHNMIGNSTGMQQVYENVLQVANSNATVLIRGESGTGKELVSHAIHYNSPRASKPFIKINCGAIPETLIESELFGYERGAFTDAREQKIGKFEAANGGTIFLDEIGELSPALQVKLLRVLQEREFERVGGLQTVKVNVRVICATNRNLEHELTEKRFREDLYYRLNVFPIFIPPLRERKTDVLLLAEYFLEKYTKENAKGIHRISSLAIDLLCSYYWPGNVRELENCMERAVLVCQTDTIQATHLPPTLQRIDSMSFSTQEEGLSFDDMVQNFERELIIDALKKTRGNKSKAAKYLQTTDRILGYKIRNLAIDFGKYRGKK